MRRRLAVLCALATCVVGLVLVQSTAATAAAYDDPCKAVEAVFARGSGQHPGSSAEANRFKDQLMDRVGSSLVHYYELGTETVDGYRYRPEDTPVGVSHPIRSVGAWAGSGHYFSYGDNVQQGRNELFRYLARRIEKCGRDTRVVLGGYSQGAQVVGEVYNYQFNDSARDLVTFNALFGDPKLWLPEGEGFNPAACRDLEGSRSPWRRQEAGAPNCDTDNGSLGARKPYLPIGYRDTTGSWCLDHDFVCGSSKASWDAAGHGRYAEPFGPVDDAVTEIAGLLKDELPDDDAAGIDASIRLVKAGTTGLDVAFIIDSTGSMGGYIDDAKAIAAQLSSYVSTVRGRVALVEYRDAGDSFTAEVRAGLDNDTTEFVADLDAISVGGGGDTPEALLHALTTAFNNLDWRPGATKAAVVLSDAGFHDPDLVDGSTLASVAQRSLEIDPVNVYPVVPSYLASEYEPLAELTSGQVVINTGDSAAALESALEKIENRPVPQLAFNRYSAAVGASVHFDGTPSYSPSSTIVKWDWDFDGDGVFEILDGDPTADHVYAAPFTGQVQLRVTDAEGLVANFSAPVVIGAAQPSAPGATSVTVTGHADVATLRWSAPLDPDYAWRITLDGYDVAWMEPAAREVEIRELERSESLTFGVTPVYTGDLVGNTVTAVLDPELRIVNTVKPMIVGAPNVGTRLRVDRGTWSPGNVQLDLQWLSDGVPVVGATRSTYDVELRDRGHRLSVRVTARLGSRATAPAAVTSDAVLVPGPAPASGTPSATSPPVITGTPKVGQRLTVSDGTWSPRPTTITRIWLRDGRVIPGATGASYVVTQEDSGHRLSALVRATSSGRTGQSESASVAVLASSPGSGSSPTPGGVLGGVLGR